MLYPHKLIDKKKLYIKLFDAQKLSNYHSPEEPVETRKCHNIYNKTCFPNEMIE